jgi:iron complex outermembrane recepter protein
MRIEAGLAKRSAAVTIAIASIIGLSALGIATARADDGDSQQLQEVVVTAEKRAENIKDVPTSISQISGADLAASHITDFEDLTRSIPNFSFTAGGNPGSDSLSIRGVSATAGQATVGVYLDDSSITVQSNATGQVQPILFDLARVEVLRGPQGTLYGASSMGGAVRFITNQPNLSQWELNVDSDVSYTKDGGVNYNDTLVMNAPINDSLAVRVAVHGGEDSGWIQRYDYQTGALIDSNSNQTGEGAMKLALLYTSGGLTITPSIWVQRIKADDSSDFYPSVGLYQTNKEVGEPSTDALLLPSLTVAQDFGAATLTSVSSYVLRDHNRVTDGTYFNDAAFAYYYLDYIPPFASHQPQNDAIIATVPSPSYFDTREKTATEELRATSREPGAGDLPIRWTGGLYYSFDRSDNSNTEYSPGLNSAFESIYGYPLSSPIVQNALGTTATTFANDLIYVAPNTQEFTERAVYGQLEYDLIPTLHAAAGVRYDDATSTLREYQSLGFYAIGTLTPFERSTSQDSLTPKFSLTYDLTPDSTVYASASEGYRLGEPVAPTPSICTGDLAALGVNAPPTSYKSDSLWNYELGTKLLLDDKRLSISAAVYLIDWTNIQQQVDLPDCGFTYIGNFGDARAEGAEIEIDYKPQLVPNLLLSVSAGGVNAFLSSTSDGLAASVGQHTLNVPNFTLNARAEYHWDIAPGTQGFVRTDYERTGKSYGSFDPSQVNYINPAYGSLNGSIGLDLNSWRVYVYGKNLLNNHQIIQYADEDEVETGYTQRPLTVGLNVEKSF